MTKFTPAIAIISIWLVTVVAVISIAKIAGFPIPLIGKIPNLEWVEFVVKFFALLLG